MPIVVGCDCGKTFRVKDELAGKRVKCSSCGKPLFIPLPSASVDKSKPTLSSTKDCSACKKPMPNDAVICVHCGLDLRTGKMLSRPKEPILVTGDQRSRFKASDRGDSGAPRPANSDDTSEMPLSSWCQTVLKFDVVWSAVAMGILSIWFLPAIIDAATAQARGVQKADPRTGVIVLTYLMYVLSIAADRKLVARRANGFGFAIATIVATVVMLVGRLAIALENGLVVSASSVFHGNEWILMIAFTIAATAYSVVWFLAAIHAKGIAVPPVKWSPPAQLTELNPVVKKILWVTLIYPLWVYPIRNGIYMARLKNISPHWFWFGIHPLTGWLTYEIIRRIECEPGQLELPAGKASGESGDSNSP